MKDRIAFIHIPKTAGSFFAEILKTAYEPNEICPSIFIHDFANFYENSPLNYRLYTGHMGFAHTYALQTKIITFLRNPIDRLASLYFYFKELSNYLATNNSLEEFIQSADEKVIIHCHDAQTWHLAFDPTIETRNKLGLKISEDDLYKQAIANLNTCSFIGITEFMDSSLDCFYQLFPQYAQVKAQFSNQRINITQQRPKISDISMSDRRILMKYCEIDYAVYDYALRLFDLQIKKNIYSIPITNNTVIEKQKTNTKVVILGGSNSVMKDGWIKSLYEQEHFEIINLSLGASSSILGVARLLTNENTIKGADYMLVEFCINDQAYILNEGILEESSVEIYLSNIIEVSLFNNIKPIIIIFPTSECFTSQSNKRTLIRDLYKKVCQRYSVMYIDFVDYIQEEIHSKTIKDIYADQWHYTETYTNEFGTRILDVLNNLPSPVNKRYVEHLINNGSNHYLTNKINYFNISDYITLENSNYYKIENSVFNGYFYKLQKADRITLHVNGNAVLYGVLANFKDGGAIIKIEFGEQQTVIKNMYDYWGEQNASHVAVKHFVHPISFSDSLSFSTLDDKFCNDITEQTLFQITPNGCEALGIAGFLLEGNIISIDQNHGNTL